MEFVCLLVTFGVCLLVAVFFAVGAMTRQSYNGQSLTPSCPWCQGALPLVRAPQTLRQFLRGGWICERCGAASDRWGQLVRPGRDHQGPRQQGRL